MKYTDRVYCINLDRRPERWQLANEQFEKHGLDVERVSAIDGHQIPGKEYLTLKPGLYGCTASHYLLVERAKYLRLKSIMVFEDDVILRDNFYSELNACMDDLPEDWQMLMLGGSHRLLPIKMTNTNRLLQATKTLTSHGYIINENVYDRVTELLRNMQSPIDSVFAEIQQLGKVFVCNPPLAWQRGGYSDIENREMYYDWIKSNEQ